MLLADTNIFLAVALDEPEKAAIVQATMGADLLAPEILPYEVGNALTAMYKRRRIGAEQAQKACEITNRIPVRLAPVDISDALEFALRFDIYAYDAYFLACARAHSCALITLDKQMARTADALEIDTITLG